MASLEKRNHSFRVVFMYGGKRYSYSLKTDRREEAEALRGGVEKTLMRLGQNLLQLPVGADIIAFVQGDGALPETPQPAERTTLAALCEQYLRFIRELRISSSGA